MKRASIRYAAIVTFMAKYINIIISLLINAILARILIPEDFGIMAVIAVFTNLFLVISDIGFGAAIIQNKDITKDDINSIFSFTIFLSILLMLLFVIISIPISLFYNNSVYLPIGALLSISLMFSTLNTIPNAIIMKEKKFELVGIRTIIVGVISGMLSIGLAKIGWKYYALVFQSITYSFCIFIWNYLSTKPQFHFKIYKNSLNKIRRFSFYLFMYNITNYFARNLDNLLVGKFMGSNTLGYYDKSYKLMLYPIQSLTYVINPILHPILSDFQNNKNIIYNKYIKLLKILSLIGIFISIYCYFSSSEIIIIMFGKQWINSIKCFSILSISIWFQLTASTAGAIYTSLGNTKLCFFSALIFVPIQIVLFIIAIILGEVTFVALAATCGLICKFFVEYYMLIKKGFNLSLIKFYKNFIPEVLIVVVTVIVMNISELIIFNNVLLSAIYKFIVCGSIYLIMLYVTKQYKYFKILLLHKSK